MGDKSRPGTPTHLPAGRVRVGVELFAHRGFAAREPENTRGAVRAAAREADWVEVDLRRCGSGEPVVIHDRTVDRVTDASGPVECFDAEELAALSVLDSGAGVPTLRSLLSVLPEDVGLNVEFKEPVYDAVELLEAAGPDRVLVSAFEPEVLGGVHERSALGSAFLVGPGADPAAALSTASELGCVAVHPHHSLVDAAFVERAHERGLAVNAWTVTDRSTADRLRQAGADGVIADTPAVC